MKTFLPERTNNAQYIKMDMTQTLVLLNINKSISYKQHILQQVIPI